MSGLCGAKSSDGPMCCWHLPLLVAILAVLFLLCIAQGNGVTGKRKPSRRFQVDAKKILNKEFCISGKDLMDGAFVEDLKGVNKGCKILQYTMFKTGKKSSETDSTTTTPVTPPDIVQKNDTTATGGTSANSNSPIPILTATATSAEEINTETATSTTTTEETTTETPRLIKRWAVSDSDDGKPLGVGRGIILGGNLRANWKKMDISLVDKNNQSLLLMAFTADATDQNASLQMAWAAPDGKPADSEIQTIAIVDDKCTCFELYFELIEEGIKITLNGNPLPKMPNIPMDSQVELKQAPEVMDIQIDADIDRLELNETTWTVPKEGKFFELGKPIEDGEIIKFSGMFFAEAKFFSIYFVYFKNFDLNTAEACMNDDTDKECSTDLDIHVDMSQNSMALRKQFVNQNNKKQWSDEDEKIKMKFTVPTTLFVAGQKFELEIKTIVTQEKNGATVFDSHYYIIQGMEPFWRNDNPAPNVIWVRMDNGVLFDDPEI